LGDDELSPPEYPDNRPDNTEERMELGEGAPHEHPVDPVRVAAARAGQLSTDQARQLGMLLSVGDLALALEVNEDAVSYGLRVLRRQGFVQRRAAGRMGFYRLTDGRTRSALIGALQHLNELARNRPSGNAQQLQPD
jgi:DNA-binding transcriptional ArsR family regulator